MVQCENGGECVEDQGGWYCDCPSTHMGLYCQKTHCEVNPCLHGGTCLPTDHGFVCICALGRHGVDCSQALAVTLPHFPGISIRFYRICACGRLSYVGCVLIEMTLCCSIVGNVNLWCSGEFYGYTSYLAYPKIWGIAGGSSYQIEFTVKAEASLSSSLVLYTGRRGVGRGMGSDYIALALENGLYQTPHSCIPIDMCPA